MYAMVNWSTLIENNVCSFKLDYSGYLALYILSSTIWLKRAWNTLIFRKAKEWRKWAENFASNTKKLLERLVRIFGRDSLEEIFGSQVTIVLMRPIRFHRLFQEILRKPSGRDRRSDNNYGLKYGIRVSSNAKEAIQFDHENGDLLWHDAILKELEVLMNIEVFKKFLLFLRKARAEGF